MDYTPPPQIKQLIISIDGASYDEGAGVASIKIERAFETSKIIRSYDGLEVALIYKDTDPNLESCPNVRVHTKNIARDIDFSENSVTMNISNISKALADNIAKQLCLVIDTSTLKKVSSINYDQNSDSGLKEIKDTLNK